MPINRHHILIAGSTAGFRARLKNIIRRIATDNSYFSIVFSEACNIDELEKEFSTHTSIALIGADFFIKPDKRLSALWKRANPACIFAVLLSENSPLYLEKVILQIQKQKVLPLSVHVLKNNYPDELIRKVIARMIGFEWTPKNVAAA